MPSPAPDPVPTFSWEAGTATGLGPFPGFDALEAAGVVFTQVSLPYVPELPARGASGDSVGRTAALLADLHFDLQPSGWRLVPNAGIDERRARSALASDVDAFEEAAQRHDGDVKVQIVGPLTLAASLELANGERSVIDQGAVRDLATSLAEGLAAHVAQITRRVPQIGRVIVQLDEWLLPEVITGNIPTASGWGRLRAIESQTAEGLLGQVIEAGGDRTGVVCSVDHPPLRFLQRAGARFVGLAGALIDKMEEDELGEALDAGLALLVGLVPADGWERRPPDLAEPVRRLWNRLTFDPADLPARIAVTHLDGLDRLSPAAAAKTLKWTADTAQYLLELAEGP